MSSSKGSTTTASFKPPEEFMKAYQQSLNMAKQAVNTPYQQYTGDLVAGLSPSQLQGIANINAAQGVALPAIQQGMSYTNQAAQGITPELYNQFYSPYVQDVANSTFNNLMESQAQQQSNLKGGAIQAGAFGGDRGGVAQAELARQQQLANSQAMSSIYNQGYTQAMGLAGQQVSNLGAMGNQMANLGNMAQGSILQGAQAQMAAGAQQQATEQARLQAAYDQWMQFMAQPYQNAQFYANIAQGLGAGAGGTSQTTAPAPDLMSQLFGAAGAIGSIYSSDERIKENIQPIGKLNDGQTIYRYNFKGDPRLQIGLLAQEVEKDHPNAVLNDRVGLKAVDYKKATDDAAQMASMGGVVGPDGGRQYLESGGLAFYPYGYAQGYIPEGKIGSSGDSIAKRAPDAPEDQGLAKDWAEIMPITSSQASGLNKLGQDLGLLDVKPSPTSDKSSSKTSDSGSYSTAPAMTLDDILKDEGILPNARGGVVGRNHYADGGDAYPDLVVSESGGDYAAKNPQGYVGRLQFGNARLQDAKNAGVIPADMTPDQFRNDPMAQKAVEKWHFADINNFIDKSGVAGAEGKAIKGIPVTREGLVSVAHLGGKGGLQKFVNSGGIYDPADANGTHLSDYLAKFSNGSGVVPASETSVEPSDAKTGVVAASASADEAPHSKFSMSKLFASDENPSLIERIMGKRLSPEARAAIMNASFAMMAGRSPFFFTNVGEAGKVGTQTYYNALAQKTNMAAKQAEMQKTQSEAALKNIEMRQNIVRMYQLSKMAYESDPANKTPFISMSQWAKMYGFPDFSAGVETGNAPAPVDTGEPAPKVSREYLPPPNGVKEATTAKEASRPYTVQPEGSATILASTESGPSANKPNTLPYLVDKLARLSQAASKSISLDPETSQTLTTQSDFVRKQIEDIRGSDAYKNMEAFNSQYERAKSDLLKLAEINSKYKGGLGSETVADAVSLLQQAGLDYLIPEGMADQGGNYDTLMKGALDMALRNASQLGSLAKAPGSLMEVESQITPNPSLQPSARYNIISRALASLDYAHDVYATWDQGYNFAQHQADFNRDRTNSYSNYLLYAQDTLPKPALYEGETIPGSDAQKNAKPVPLDAATQDMLNKKFPDAADGTVAKSKSGISAKKVNGIWVTIKG